MNATTSAALILAVMVGAYVMARVLKVSTELSLLAAAMAGSLAGGNGIPARHIVEGAFTYFDIILIFVAATLFMNLLKESGGAAFAVRAILRRFHRRKGFLLALLAILLLIPGALTGAGSVTVLILGGMVATVLGTMEIPKPKVAAIIFVIAGLSAAAPPINLWAMLTAAGVNMPYVGFFLPLLVPCVILALMTIFILGAKAKPVDLEKALRELPEAPPRMNW
ncbi:MAG: C4-dicarboxylate ABC transporter, partial [Candidatus Aminicenantales bacterium]